MIDQKVIDAAIKSIVEQDKDKALEIIKAHIAGGGDPMEIMEQGFVAGIAEVGDLFGRGKVFLAMDPSIADLYSGSRKRLYRAVDAAMGIRTAWCRDARFELTTREAPDTRERFLFAVSRSGRDAATDMVHVGGEYADPQDIGMSPAFPVKSRRSGGVTSFELRLGPGEGTCIALGRYRELPRQR